jgi:trigger factor
LKSYAFVSNGDFFEGAGMQVSVETLSALERRMEVQVPAAQVEKAIDERLLSMSRNLRLKGFRPGKVPVKVVRQQFGPQVRQEVLNAVMQSSFAEALDQQKLVPAAGPQIEPLDLQAGQDLKYRAVFEVLPEIKLNGLDSLQLTRPVAEVAAADVDAMIETLRAQRPTYTAVERAARDGDRVTVDFTGTVDGVAFDGGAGKDVQIVMGSGRMLPDFEAGMRGAQTGAELTVPVKFPAQYPAAALAGKQASFAITVHKVEEPQLPALDDEFCKLFGVHEGGIDRLRAEVTENMQEELAASVRARLKRQIFDALLAANPFDIPKTLVEEQMRNMVLDAGRRMGARDVSQLPPAEQFQDGAKQRVALGLLLREVIKDAQLTVDRAKVQEQLAELAQNYPDPEQVAKAYRENAQLRSQLESKALEDQAVEWLLGRAKIVEQQASFKEVMNFGA